MRARGRNVKLVVVGGAVSTILLSSRRSTHDVDFFAEDLNPKDSRLLKEAADEVRRMPGSNLEDGWFNNHTIYFIDVSLRKQLTKQGFAQNDIVFQAPGLTLYAAPWIYAFVSKLDRIQGGGYRSHDPGDAAVFLDRWLKRTKRETVSVAALRDAMRTHELAVRGDEGFMTGLGLINDAFAAKFGRRPITR